MEPVLSTRDLQVGGGSNESSFQDFGNDQLDHLLSLEQLRRASAMKSAEHPKGSQRLFL